MSEILTNTEVELSHRRTIAIAAIQHLREDVGLELDSHTTWTESLGTALDVSSAWVDRQLVGIGFLVGGPRHALLCDIVVQRERQRTGIGSRLVRELVNTARELDLQTVTVTYDTSIANLEEFFHRVGFSNIYDAMQLA